MQRSGSKPSGSQRWLPRAGQYSFPLTPTLSLGERSLRNEVSHVDPLNRSAAFTPLPRPNLLWCRLFKRRKRRAPDLRFMESPLSFLKACIGTMNLIEQASASVASRSMTV